jgi:hypothetical protein
MLSVHFDAQKFLLQTQASALVQILYRADAPVLQHLSIIKFELWLARRLTNIHTWFECQIQEVKLQIHQLNQQLDTEVSSHYMYTQKQWSEEACIQVYMVVTHCRISHTSPIVLWLLSHRVIDQTYPETSSPESCMGSTTCGWRMRKRRTASLTASVNGSPTILNWRPGVITASTAHPPYTSNIFLNTCQQFWIWSQIY